MFANKLKYLFASLLVTFVALADGPPPQPFGPAPIIRMWKDCDGLNYLRSDGFCASPGGGGSGTVTSVALSAPSIFDVSGSPITTDGTLALSFATGQTANRVLASPDGSPGALSLRALVAADLPAGVGTVTSVALTMPTGFSVGGSPVTSSGALAVTSTLNGIIKGNGSSVFSAAASSDVIGLWTGTCNSGTFLRADGSCQAVSASPAGSNTQIQFNNSGAFGADADFVWNATTNVLTLGAGGTQIVGGVNGGAAFIIQGANASGGNNGADMSIFGGTGGTGGARGGNLVVSGGLAASGGEQGALTLQSGTGGSTPGDVNIKTDNTTRITFDGDGSWDLGGNTPGSSGQVLVSNGSGSAPTWQADPLLAGTNTFTGLNTWSSTEPRLLLNESDQGSNEKLWDWDVSGKIAAFRSRTDADGAGTNAIAVTRGTGTALTNVSLGNTTDNPSGNWLGSGTFTFGNAVSAGRYIVTGTTVPSTGIYLSSSGLGFSVGSTNRGKFDVNGNFITVQATADQSYSKQTPTTGFSITIANNISTLILDPAGTLATGTITMPATPIDGQNVRFTTSQIITALTVSANSGQSIVGAPTTLALGQGAAFIYVLSNTTWYRLYLGQ